MRQLLASVLECIGDGVVATDSAGRIVLVSPAARRLLGLDVERAVSREWTEHLGAFHPAGGVPVATDAHPLARALRGERPEPCDLLFRNERVPAGSVLHAEARPLFAEDGALEGAVLVLRNRRDLAEKRRLQARVDELDGELQSFSYSVSHDLRAPLRSIDGFSQALLEDLGDRLDDRARDYLGRVRGAAQRMGKLMDDLLRLSRLTRSEIHRERMDLSAAARTIADELRASDPSRDVRFAIEDGLVAEGDARLLGVALRNLLANSWKFTSKQPRASIEFGLSTASGHPEYFVRDDGAGFDPRYASKLFGPFQRLHSASEFEGTGMGLATVQRIVHRHGGRVRAESAVGEGATFYFTLGP